CGGPGVVADPNPAIVGCSGSDQADQNRVRAARIHHHVTDVGVDGDSLDGEPGESRGGDCAAVVGHIVGSIDATSRAPGQRIATRAAEAGSRGYQDLTMVRGVHQDPGNGASGEDVGKSVRVGQDCGIKGAVKHGAN